MAQLLEPEPLPELEMAGDGWLDIPDATDDAQLGKVNDAPSVEDSGIFAASEENPFSIFDTSDDD